MEMILEIFYILDVMVYDKIKLYFFALNHFSLFWFNILEKKWFSRDFIF